MSPKPYILYAMAGSLYSAKARAMLVRKGLPFEERVPGHPAFRDEVVPRLGRWIIPVLATPEGELVQDGTDILDHLEQHHPCAQPALPATPRHRIVALLFQLFGGEGLLRPAMHYRWNFDAHNLGFLLRDFTGGLVPGGTDAECEQAFARSSGRMRKAAAGFGVTPETAPLVEASYLEFLQLFNEHLAAMPYLLGGRPTVGDYGLLGPLFPHLGRDPYPATLMKQRAWRVWRWTERMNRAQQDTGEYPDASADLLAGDAVPPSLLALMRYVAEEYLAELRAHVAFVDAWLATQAELPAGSIVGGKPGARSLGVTSFPWRGTTLTVQVLPYRLHLLQHIQDAFDAMDPIAQAEVASLLAQAGLMELLTLRAKRRVERRDNLEVWG